MSPVEVKEGQDRKEMGINRESNSERVAVLSWTVRRCVPPELAQSPPLVRSPRGCSLFCLLSRLGSQGFPLGGGLGARTVGNLVSRVVAEEAELKLVAVVPLLGRQLAVLTELVGVWVL